VRRINFTGTDPREPGTQIGPLVSQDALKRVNDLVEDAVSIADSPERANHSATDHSANLGMFAGPVRRRSVRRRGR